MKNLLFLVGLLAVGCSGPVVIDDGDPECEPAGYELVEAQDIEPSTTNAAELDCGTGTLVDAECRFGDGVTPVAEGLDPSNDLVFICIGRVKGDKPSRVAVHLWCEP